MEIDPNTLLEQDYLILLQQEQRQADARGVILPDEVDEEGRVIGPVPVMAARDAGDGRAVSNASRLLIELDASEKRQIKERPDVRKCPECSSTDSQVRANDVDTRAVMRACRRCGATWSAGMLRRAHIRMQTTLEESGVYRQPPIGGQYRIDAQGDVNAPTTSGYRFNADLPPFRRF